MARVTALRAFEFGDRTVRPGEQIDVSAVDAIFLANAGSITLTKKRPVPVVAAPVPEPGPVAEPVRRRRTYRRKDLTAEATTACDSSV